jgi:hypothetical protein
MESQGYKNIKTKSAEDELIIIEYQVFIIEHLQDILLKK